MSITRNALDVMKRTCEISADFPTGEAKTVMTGGNLTAIMALAWVNFFKQRLHVLQLDYKHVTADRIVIASRPHGAESGCAADTIGGGKRG